MKRSKWWTYGIFLVLTEAVGGLSSLLTHRGMQQVSRLPQSALTPPGIVFSVVWPVLYALMAVGAARIWMQPESAERSRGLWLYVFQLIFNFFWSLFYFNMQAFGFSVLWLIALWILIALMILSWRRTDALAAFLQLPYLIWVAFAGYLNLVMWRLNG